MIKIYATKVECIDTETKDMLFTGESFDAECCTIEVKTALSEGNVKEVTDAIIEAVKLLCAE